MINEDVVKQITKMTMERLKEQETFQVSVGISNRHVHLSRADLDTLFGAGFELTEKSKLNQPGQFASHQTVTLRGPKGEFENVRILGPVRPQSQVEISLTDSFRLGVKAPIKESGKLAGTPGIEIIGPKGSITLPEGTIVALRHIHMLPEQAEKFGVHDKEVVEVEALGERRGILGNVLVRVTDTSFFEMHIDVDEANACGLKNGDYCIVHKCKTEE